MKFMLSTILFLFTITGFCQGPLGNEGVLSDREIFKKTLLLENPGGGHGTGFIVKFNNKSYLVTAEHVFANLNDSTKLYYKDTAGKAKYFLLGELLRLNGKFNVKVNPNADVAIGELYPKNQAHQTFLINAALPFESVYGGYEAVPRQFNVIVYGYPLYDFDFFEPMSYSTYLSSGYMKLERADKKGSFSLFYLLSDPGMQGFSGGPVFIGVSNQGMVFGPSKTTVVGIVHGTRGDVSGGKYAVITPSAYIIELLRTFN